MRPMGYSEAATRIRLAGKVSKNSKGFTWDDVARAEWRALEGIANEE